MKLRASEAFVALAAAAVLLGAACSAGTQPAAQPALYDPKALPTGPVGKSIAYGRAIVEDTPRMMKGYVNARMACAACHLDGGTKARGGSFAGTYARFPQWNKRAHRVIVLEDRLAECFLYSMNGHPPAYGSKAMNAMVAYVAWLSRGVAVGAKQPADQGFLVPLPSASPDLSNGAQIYAAKCTACHQASGNGLAATFPPLWGPASFNSGAGMAHIDRMAGFVRYNMPLDAPGSLSLPDAYDVSAFVLSHERPRFNGSALVQSSPQPAKYF